MKIRSGFTLIELIIFIVVMGILAGGILTAAITTMKHSPAVRQQAIAMNAAMQCLDWVLGQRQLNGYNSIPCPSASVPSFCSSLPAGFNISVQIICPVANYKTVTVSVSGLGDASLQLLLANYP